YSTAASPERLDSSMCTAKVSNGQPTVRRISARRGLAEARMIFGNSTMMSESPCDSVELCASVVQIFSAAFATENHRACTENNKLGHYFPTHSLGHRRIFH